MKDNMLIGKLHNDNGNWVVTCQWNHLDRGFERHEFPVNPNDRKKLNPLTDDGKLVNFEIITIGHGTDEFDVMDMDVAKIFV